MENKKKKIGIVLMIIGVIFNILAFVFPLSRNVCCGVSTGKMMPWSAIEIWIYNYQQRLLGVCKCDGFSGPDGMTYSFGGVATYHYIPVEFIIIGLVLFFIGLKKYRKSRAKSV